MGIYLSRLRNPLFYLWIISFVFVGSVQGQDDPASSPMVEEDVEESFTTTDLPNVDAPAVTPKTKTSQQEEAELQTSYPFLLVDLFGRKWPDLLAGPYWTVPRAFSVDGEVYRPFDIDGEGQRLVEWVGGNSAFLVWSKTKPEVIDGTNLFGLHTFGKSWNDPYEPLGELDANKDGVLEEGELKELWLWVDKDSDGYISPDEVDPFTLKAISIQLAHETDAYGNSWKGDSVKLRDGSVVSSWGWRSLGINPTLFFTQHGRVTNLGAAMVLFKQSEEEQACLYNWSILKTKRPTSGVLRFIDTKHGLYVLSTGNSGVMSTAYTALRSILPFANYYSTYSLVSKAGDTMFWEFETSSDRDSSTVLVEQGGNLLSAAGMFQSDAPNKSGPYSWAGYPAKSPDLLPDITYSLLSVDPKEFEMGLEQTGKYEAGVLVLPPNDKLKNGGKYPRIITIEEEVRE